MGSDSIGPGRRSRLGLALMLAAVTVLAAFVLWPKDDAPPAPPRVHVEVVVDGTPVARLDASAIGKRLDLTEVVPEAKRDVARWVMLDVRARDGRRRIPIERPAARYPLQDFCLYTSRAGIPSFGVYRRDHPDLHPRMRELLSQPAPYLEDVARVNVRTAETPAEARARTLRGTLALVVDGGTPRRVDAAALDAVPAIEAPPTPEDPGDLRDRPGLWWLREVVALAVDPDAVRSATLVDLAGEAHALDVATLREDATTRSALKRNRRGALHVRFLEGERVTAAIRDVVRIDLATR